MKKLLVLFAVVATTYVSQAAYLYWQVDKTDVEGLVGASDTDYATVFAYNTDTHVTQKLGSMEVVDRADAIEMSIDLGSYAGNNWVYYVEVSNYASSTVHGTSLKQDWSNSEQSYTSMANNNYIGSTLDVPTLQVWHGGAIAAPEPTSAMMILLGLAGLALKRKKV